MLKKTEEVNLLLDFYENLLTSKQQEVLRLYYKEDLSLREIAELLNNTHASIYDTIKRSEAKLLKYESNLGLVEKHQARNQIYDKIKTYQNEAINQLIKQLESIEKEEL